MEREDIISLANQLMEEHGLIERGWRFIFNYLKSTVGQCCYRDKTISFSYYFMEMSTDKIKDILLHEIAHALVPIGVGHGPEWKQMARSIGCSANRTTKTGIVEHKKYLYYCPNCGKTIGFSRRLRRERSCDICDNKWNPEIRLILKEESFPEK